MKADENIKVEKWSTGKFFIGVAKLFINMATASWVIYTIVTYKILEKIFIATNGELQTYLTAPVMIILISGWVVSTVIVGCNLQKAVAAMVENAKINMEFKTGISKTINTDTAKVLEAIKNIRSGS